MLGPIVSLDTPLGSPSPDGAPAATGAQLRESEQRFRLAMAHAPIGMALVGLDGSFLEVNARLCEIVGRPEEVLRTLTFQDITHPDDLDADLNLMQQLLAGEISWYSMEKRYLHADGHQVWILLSGSLVRDDHGAPVHFIAQIQDITGRKTSEAELQRLNRELERSNAELQRFAAVASHDLASPLGTVRGLLDLLLRTHDDALDEAGRDLIARARRQTVRLSATVTALLELAELGTTPLAPTAVALDRVVADILEDLAPELDDGDAEVQVLPLPRVRADERQLRLLLQNLLSNALRYRDPSRPPTVRISAERSGDRWQVSVEDDGRGIDPDERERIFEPFVRGSRAGQLAGTGLGLATCRRIVERHGGTIVAEPLAPGARFTFDLPADDAPVSGWRAG
jgi:PAS domain S-box-containing protein